MSRTRPRRDWDKARWKRHERGVRRLNEVFFGAPMRLGAEEQASLRDRILGRRDAE